MKRVLLFLRRQWVWWLPALAAVTAWVSFHAASRRQGPSGYAVWGCAVRPPEVARDASGTARG
jgi:hypothetical protein